MKSLESEYRKSGQKDARTPANKDQTRRASQAGGGGTAGITAGQIWSGIVAECAAWRGVAGSWRVRVGSPGKSRPERDYRRYRRHRIFHLSGSGGGRRRRRERRWWGGRCSHNSFATVAANGGVQETREKRDQGNRGKFRGPIRGNAFLSLARECKKGVEGGGGRLSGDPDESPEERPGRGK